MKTTATLFVCLAAASLTACQSSGIRKLSEVETTYFKNLNTHLKKSVDPMKDVLNKSTAVNEEAALRQIALLDNNIRRAKLIYSVREVLTAPQNNSAAFVQVTRNKIILYYLAEAGKAENEKLKAELAKGQVERKQLISSIEGLNQLVSEAIASHQALQNHLNKSGSAQLSDIVAEVGRQVTAFNEGIKKADQDNPAIQRMVEAGKVAENRLQQADEGLSRFIGVWSKLNKEGK